MGNDLTKVTVNLIPRSTKALEEAATLMQDSKTDTINRAIQLYAFIIKKTRNEGNDLCLITPDGEVHKLTLL